MKKLLIIFFILISISYVEAGATSLLKKFLPDFNLFKGEVNTKIDKNSNELGVIKDNITNINTSLNSLIKINTDIKTSLNANAEIVAGINNSIKNTSTSGRDSISIVNDPKVLIFVIFVLFILLLYSIYSKNKLNSEYIKLISEKKKWKGEFYRIQEKYKYKKLTKK